MKLISPLLLIITIAILFALPPLDPDLGWFIRCGQENCSTNTFSVLLPNYHWTRPMIIYPKIITFIFNNFSFWGLTISNILLGLACFFFFHKIIKKSLHVSAILFIISTLLSYSTLSLGLRNQNLGILYFLITIYLLESKKFIFLPFLFLIWANTHPSFPLGLGLVFFYSLSNLRNLRYLISSTAATLINPHGIYIYSDILSHYQTPMNTLVAEWVPPSTPTILLIIFIAILILTVSKIRPNVFYTCALIFTAVLSISARRNLIFFYFLLPLALAPKFKTKFNIPQFFLLPVSILILISSANLILPKTYAANTNWNSYCHLGVTNFPCEATEFLKTQNPGNIFNTYEWGGFLIWQLPQFKVFIDGRSPAWPGNPYMLYLSTYQTKSGWQVTLEKYKIDYILISPGTFLDLELKKGTYPWKQIFKSEFSVLYKKW